MQLGVHDPFSKRKPQPVQQALLSQDLMGPAVKRVNLVTGRGGGKSLGVAMLAAFVSFEDRGTVGLVTAPTTSMLRDVFLDAWRMVVPERMFTYVKTENTIHLINGSKILLRSRHADNPSRGRELARGLNINWCIDDEAALGFQTEQYLNVDACIRRPGNYRFHVTITTPRLGNDYYDFVTQDGHVLLEGFSTMDNPWLPEKFGENLEGQMSKRQADREVYGKWTELEGFIWPDFKLEQWPEGNLHWHEHDHSEPYVLAFDPGVASSAWVIMQKVPAVDRYDRPAIPGEDHIWVATAEFTPKVDGSATSVLADIAEEYGIPERIIAGHDINTRADTNGRTIKYYIRQIFGAHPSITPITGDKMDKRRQYNRLSWLINDSTGARRFCVSKGLKQHNPQTKRGILKVMQQDVWPDELKRKRGEFLPKDKRLEHMRDALLYWAIWASPPRFVKARTIASN